jgi:pyridoxal 5'-phosphate synthase pdxS subunit
MEAAQPPTSALPNKLFLSGSDLHTPVEGAHSPARPPVNGTSSSSVGTFAVKAGLAQMLKICPPFLLGRLLMVRRGYHGCCQVIVQLRVEMLTLSCSAEQARIAEEAGACAVMALERVPADIRRDGGVARMSDPKMIKEIMDAVSIPVMAKVRIGHFVEAQVPYTYLLGPLTYDRFLRQLELTTLMRVKC